MKDLHHPRNSIMKQIRCNRLSCFCAGCSQGKICLERDGRRSPDEEKILVEIHNQTGDNEVANNAMTRAGWDVLEKAKEGDMMGVFVQSLHRAGSNEKDSDLWASGRFTIGEVAERVKSKKNTGSKRCLKLFLPEEVRQEVGFRYQSRAVCRSGEDGSLVSADSGCKCGKKHYTSVPITLVKGGPWMAYDLQPDDDEWKVATMESDDDGGDNGTVNKGGGQRVVGGHMTPKQSLRALQKHYINKRGGGVLANAEEEQRLLLPLGVRQYMTQIDDKYIEEYFSTLTM